MATSPPVLVRVLRDGVVESVHRGHVVVADAAATVRWSLGEAGFPTYVRSAAKPFQAVATRSLLAEAGLDLPLEGLAIACASHVGSATHQIEAAHVLALAGLDEAALRCPAALPEDVPALVDQRGVPVPLAHNCSGKHAGFLYAHTATGGAPADYLALDAPVQRRAREALGDLLGAPPAGPGVDGCGAPAWVLPLAGLAAGFARLAAGGPDLAVISAAMRARPDLVGGDGCPDTALMRADPRVVAKRGAEGVLAAGAVVDGRPVGVAVKVEDGANRAPGPVVAAVLESLGCRVPPELRAPVVLGGGRPHGLVEVDPGVAVLAPR